METSISSSSASSFQSEVAARREAGAAAVPLCVHCGAPVPKSSANRDFCCSGCEAAYAIVTALGLLADLSEDFPADRGAVMSLYSVFLALGQIGGDLVGRFVASWAAGGGPSAGGAEGGLWRTWSSPCGMSSRRRRAASSRLRPGA